MALFSCSFGTDDSTLVCARDCNGSFTYFPEFGIEYGCSTISGNLIIEGVGDISNLLEPGLRSIGGDLIIHHNHLLSLHGLESLTAVGGSVTIKNNTSLLSLDGLQFLATVGGCFTASENPSLVSLNGLEQTMALNMIGCLDIRSNPKLISLSGLENLMSVQREVVLSNNGALTSLKGLENLESIGYRLWGLSIKFNTALSSLGGFGSSLPCLFHRRVCFGMVGNKASSKKLCSQFQSVCVAPAVLDASSMRPWGVFVLCMLPFFLCFIYLLGESLSGALQGLALCLLIGLDVFCGNGLYLWVLYESHFYGWAIASGLMLFKFLVSCFVAWKRPSGDPELSATRPPIPPFYGLSLIHI